MQDSGRLDEAMELRRSPSSVAMMGRMLKLSNLVMRPFHNFLSDKYDLNFNELRVIMSLAPEREVAAHEIAKMTGMQAMNVSRAAASLLKSGRISARRGVDGRRKMLSLTDKGRALHDVLMPPAREVADRLFEGMTPLETDFLDKLLQKLVTHMDLIDINEIGNVDHEVDTEASASSQNAGRKRRKRIYADE